MSRSLTSVTPSAVHAIDHGASRPSANVSGSSGSGPSGKGGTVGVGVGVGEGDGVAASDVGAAEVGVADVGDASGSPPQALSSSAPAASTTAVLVRIRPASARVMHPR